MRRLVAFLIDLLPFDARSHRALDETLLDWAHEEAEAHGVGRRLVATARGTLAVGLAAAIAASSEVRRVPFATLAWQIPSLSIASAIVCGFVQRWDSFPAWMWTPWQTPLDRHWDILCVLLFHRAAEMLPIAFFVVACLSRRRPERQMPWVGLSIVAAATTLLVGGWMLPVLDRAQGWSAYYTDLVGPTTFAVRGTTLFSELTAAWNRDADTAFTYLFFTTGAAALAVAFVIAAARLPTRVRPIWLILLPPVFLETLVQVGNAHNNYFFPYPVFGRSLAWWWISLAVMIVAVVLARRRGLDRLTHAAAAVATASEGNSPRDKENTGTIQPLELHPAVASGSTQSRTWGQPWR